MTVTPNDTSSETYFTVKPVPVDSEYKYQIQYVYFKSFIEYYVLGRSKSLKDIVDYTKPVAFIDYDGRF